MGKLNINLIASVFIMCCTLCFIAVLHYTSFERHHTHDWPKEHSKHSQETTNPNKISNGTAVSILNRYESLDGAKPRQSYPAYTDYSSLQKDDHKAQIAMAFFTLIGLLIGGAGLIMIWKTLTATQDAASSAKNATSAAWEAVRVAKETAEQDTRPWIFLEREFECDFLYGADRPSLRWNYELSNIGKTPARQVSVRQDIVGHKDLMDVRNIFRDKVEKWKGEARVRSGKVVLPNEPSIDSPMYARVGSLVEEGSNLLSLIVCVTYLYADGKIGVDAQAFTILQENGIGPRSHVLKGHPWCRIVE